MGNSKFIVFDKRETVIESLVKDLGTFCFVALAVYVSRDSRWWTFFTGSMAILALFGNVGQRQKRFTSKAELKAWVDSIEEP